MLGGEIHRIARRTYGIAPEASDEVLTQAMPALRGLYFKALLSNYGIRLSSELVRPEFILSSHRGII